MEKNTFNPVSSTPCPRKKLKDSIGSDIIGLSPITFKQHLQRISAKLIAAKSQKARFAAQVNKVVSKRKQHVNTEKGAPSDAVLSINQTMASNTLNPYGSLYSMFQEPILVDSDEDEIVMVTSNDTREPLGKKARRADKPATSVKSQINTKKKKGTRTTFVDSDEDDQVMVTTNDTKEPLRKKTRQAHKPATSVKSEVNNKLEKVLRTIYVDSDEDDQVMVTTNDTKKPLRKKTRQADKPATSVKSEVNNKLEKVFKTRGNKLETIDTIHTNTVQNPLPLVNEKNVELQRFHQQIKVHNGDSTTAPSIVVLNEKESTFVLDDSDSSEESLFPKSFAGSLNVQPSSRKGVDNSAEPFLSLLSYGAEPEEKPSQTALNFATEKESLFDYFLKEKNKKRINFPEGSVSHFKTICFRRLKYSGALVAKCLDTGSNDMGYIEVEINQMFIAVRPNTIYVVLEGQVCVRQGEASDTLVAGDMINCTSGAEYCFENRSLKNVRLLYVKSKAQV